MEIQTDTMTRDQLVGALYASHEKYNMARAAMDSVLAILLVECDLAIGDPEEWMPEKPLTIRVHRAIVALRALAAGGCDE